MLRNEIVVEINEEIDRLLSKEYLRLIIVVFEDYRKRRFIGSLEDAVFGSIYGLIDEYETEVFLKYERRNHTREEIRELDDIWSSREEDAISRIRAAVRRHSNGEHGFPRHSIRYRRIRY